MATKVDKETDALAQTCKEFAELNTRHTALEAKIEDVKTKLKQLGAQITAALRVMDEARKKALLKKNGEEKNLADKTTFTVDKCVFTFQPGKGTWDITKPFTMGDVCKAIEEEGLKDQLFSMKVDAGKVRDFADACAKGDKEKKAQLRRLHIAKTVVDWFSLTQGASTIKPYGKPGNRLK